MAKIFVQSGEKIDSTLRRFRKQCERDGLIKDIKRCEYYETRTVRKKRKKAKALKKIKALLKEKTEGTGPIKRPRF